MVLAAAMAICANAAPKKKKPAKGSAGKFEYYLLTLSWAPDFCAVPSNPQDPAECGQGRKVGFVVHGLWPQGDQGKGPENCGGPQVPQNIIDAMLKYMPTASLIQHEWSTHGTCSGLSLEDYFAAVRKARDSVTIPDDLQTPSQSRKLSPGAIENKFGAANPAFPKTAFRTSCSHGTLQEVRICFTKDLAPQGCTASAGECTMKTMTVLPVQ